MKYSKRKWKKEVKEGMTNMDFETWKRILSFYDKHPEMVNTT